MPSAKTQRKATNSKTATSKKTAKSVTKRATKKVAKKSTKPVVKAPKNLKVKKASKKVRKGGHIEEEEVAGKRYFKCIMINKEGVAISSGRYSGKKPKQAASKACTRLIDSYKNSDEEIPEKIVFGMHECTRASKKKKKYFYTGCRIQLEEPEEVEIKKIDPKTGKNMVIRYNYNNDVRKLTDVDTCEEYPLLCNYDAKEGEEQEGGAKKVKVVKKGKKVPKKGTKKVATKKVVKKAVSKKAASKKSASKKSAPKKQIKVVKKAAKKVTKKGASKGKKVSKKAQK